MTGFRWVVPERFNFARDVFDAQARHPDLLALLLVDDRLLARRVSYGELSQRSRRLARGLLDRGFSPGERVLVVLPRRVEWWETLLACSRAGLVACPGTVQLTAKDIAQRLDAAEIAAVVTDADVAPRVEEAIATAQQQPRLLVLADAAPRGGWTAYEDLLAKDAGVFRSLDTASGDPSLLFFTSGTTGLPKMALHTEASYGIGHVVTGRHWLGLRPGELHWNLSDTGWAKAAWSSFFGPFICGAAVVAHTNPRFEAARALEILRQHPVASLCGTPTHYRLLVQEKLARFPALRSCCSAGEPLNPEVIEVWREATGLSIREGYGQTETVLVIGTFPGDEVVPGSIGRAAPGFDMRVVDEHGVAAPADEEGEIALALGPPAGLFAGYWKDEARTAEVMRGGLYRTGDRARRDAQGRFWFVGRSDDVIKSGGYRIGPFEVESALLEHPAVVESAVVGVPDALRGQVVKAFVVLARGAEPGATLIAELQRFVQERTAPYKYPRQIEFVEALPKTVSGKIRRVDLRQRM